MSLFHKHSWELLSETVTESKFEHTIKAGPKGASNLKIPWQMSDASRKLIQTFSCKKCGQLRRYVEKI